MKDKLRHEFLESAVKAKISFVATHCYSHNYISLAGLADPVYVETLEKRLNKLGAKFYPVHLKANNEELLKRVSMNSRREFRKLKSKKIMRTLIPNHDWQNSPDLKNNLVIDNTNLSPKKVAEMIITHFKLKPD